jgi:ATP-dependent helicase/nuclease subunit A
MAEQVLDLEKGIGRLAAAKDIQAAIAELCECAMVRGEREKAWASEEDYQAVKVAFEGMRQELPNRLQAFADNGTGLVEAVAVGQRFLRVAMETCRVYRQHKRRHGVIDFQDLLVLTRDLLRDHPEVRQRLQRRYKVLLIDELQDTDPVQCELIELLSGAELTQGKLFAVGDHKQSIYRFRGADVTLFLEMRDRLPHEGRLDLTFNFRSQPEILRFANALFERHMPQYEPLQGHLSQLNPDACVEFLWSEWPPEARINEARACEADAIARRIVALVGEKLVADRSPPEAKLRPVIQGDIVLLFRAMSNVALYETALQKHGLDYYLVGGRAFFAQQEIYDLLNLLRALENPQDALSLAGTLRSPFCCLSDEALFLLSRYEHGLWAGLHDEATLGRLPADQQPDARRACRFLDRWHDLKDRLPIARLLGQVLADSGFDAAMQFESLGDRKLANLWKLLDLARTFDRSGLFGLAQFIDRLGDLVQAQPPEEQAATQPEQANVVRLMSIHQAKGLEFPVVIIPDFAATTRGNSPPVAQWKASLGCVVRPPADEELPPFSGFGAELAKKMEEMEDWHEALRILYVACTRAQDYLILSAALEPECQPNTPWMAVLADAFDLRTGTAQYPSVSDSPIPKVRVAK